jgi:catechol 2,3-dioxygenase-like lactoylglutathione lyase family enzyme
MLPPEPITVPLPRYYNILENSLRPMEPFYVRSVFFVKHAPSALTFYTETLGFALDWNYQENGQAFVFQVSLFGFQLIVNQVQDGTLDRAGHGRVFLGLEPDQVQALREHLEQRGVPLTKTHWGEPTLVLHDLDRNEIFFWEPKADPS